MRVLLLVALATLSFHAGANEAFLRKYLTVGQVQITEEPDMAVLTEVMMPTSVENDCSAMPNTPAFSPTDLSDVIWDQIDAIGARIWKIIEDNKPVVDLNFQAAHALPRGVVCWSDLDSWKAPRSQRYRATYKNAYGMKVVDFAFRVVFSYGGGRDGKGLYIANAAVYPAQLDVSWGYKFNAEAKVGQALNLGTSASPMAGLEIAVNWNLGTVVKDSQTTVNFFMQGDGLMTKLE